jgi:crossover junction endodeoxyribonuclease RuvC
MRVLGIDPGLTRCGWGVVDGRPGARPTALGVGVIRTMAELDLELRLLELHTAVTALLREHRPDVVAIERVFSQNNKGTATGTAQAAGVAALAAAQADRPVAWHTPSEVKAAISGNGRADKEQVTLMVTDALALAVCHAWRGPAQDRLRKAAIVGGIGAPIRQTTLPRWTGVAAR